MKKITQSAVWQKYSGIFKIGFISSIFYASTSGACPCCGAPASSCGTSLSVLGAVGILSSTFFCGLARLGELWKKVPGFFRNLIR